MARDDILKRSGALIYNWNRTKCLFVTQRSSGMLGIPKGKVKKAKNGIPEEHPLHAMYREVLEETGLRLARIARGKAYHIIKHRVVRHIVYRGRDSCFVIHLDQHVVLPRSFKDQHEISNRHWLTIDEFFSYKGNELTRGAVSILANRPDCYPKAGTFQENIIEPTLVQPTCSYNQKSWMSRRKQKKSCDLNFLSTILRQVIAHNTIIV